MVCTHLSNSTLKADLIGDMLTIETSLHKNNKWDHKTPRFKLNATVLINNCDTYYKWPCVHSPGTLRRIAQLHLARPVHSSSFFFGFLVLSVYSDTLKLWIETHLLMFMLTSMWHTISLAVYKIKAYINLFTTTGKLMCDFFLECPSGDECRDF